jgi:hypothetical protein
MFLSVPPIGTFVTNHIFLYVPHVGTHITSDHRLSRHDLEARSFDTSSPFRVFEFTKEFEIQSVQHGLHLEEVHLPNVAMVSSATAFVANSLAPHDILYGLRTKDGVRTSSRNEKADHITCPCGKKAFRHVKLWEPIEQQREVYICDCRKQWVEIGA